MIETSEKETVSRVELARHFKVALPTVDGWVERGCPVLNRGKKGKECEFSLPAVKAWRSQDALRLKSRNPADYGLEHLNPLRFIAEESAFKFLWRILETAPAVEQTILERGVDPKTAKLLTVDFAQLVTVAFEHWISADTFNKVEKARGHMGLDELFAHFRPDYKGTSAPPKDFNLDHIELPKALQRIGSELMALKGEK